MPIMVFEALISWVYLMSNQAHTFVKALIASDSFEVK